MEDSLKDKKEIENSFFEQLGEIYDPEIMAPITDLGLIYRIELKEDKSVEVDFTLTYPGCPWGPVLEKSIRKTLKRKNEWLDDVKTSMVFDPPWQVQFAKEELRIAMGYPI